MSFSREGETLQNKLRLSTIASFHSGQTEVWDIGCDHGLLGLSFRNVPDIQAIYLVDPSLDVINDLKTNLIDSHIPGQNLFLNLHIIHKPGQDLKLSPQQKCLFIAGMGGKEIEEIIKNFLPQMSEYDRLVISPHRKILELRSYLKTTELGLVQEVAVEENDQFYQIIVLEKKSALPKLTPYGTDLWQSSVGRRYLQKDLQSFTAHRDPLSRGYVDHLRAILAGQKD